MILDLNPPPKVITFDCYGTLVRWHEVMREAIREVIAATNRLDLDPGLVLDRYSRHERRLQHSKPHMLYKKVLSDGFTKTFHELDVPIRPGDVDSLVQSHTRIGPHPETREVLAKLRSRYQLAIFTNSDEDLIAHSVRRLEVPIDHVITAESARLQAGARDFRTWAPSHGRQPG